jgi:hypothetical protein
MASIQIGLALEYSRVLERLYPSPKRIYRWAWRMMEVTSGFDAGVMIPLLKMVPPDHSI